MTASDASKADANEGPSSSLAVHVTGTTLPGAKLCPAAGLVMVTAGGRPPVRGAGLSPV